MNSPEKGVKGFKELSIFLPPEPPSSRPLLDQTPWLRHNALPFPQALFTHFVGQQIYHALHL